MKKHFCLLLLMLPLTLVGQTPISGVINRYAAVNNINYCSSTLSVNNAAGFAPGDRVLIIQMKGAIINSSGTAAFGSITNLGAAGKYEWATVQTVQLNNIRVQFALANNYDITGNVQMVWVPRYTDAVITGQLSAPAWNGSIGGVLAMQVSGTLNFQEDIDLSAGGFRGGIADINAVNGCSWLIPQNGYFYPLNNWRGAAKGEGIAVFLNGAESGRGPQANGGGGGNDHNAGGGGGGNSSAGGQGGTNNEPSTFGCSGQFPGLGGRAVALDGTHLIMGGGGGAGHENNDLASPGARGGGIVLITAGLVEGNGRAIKVNGGNASNSLSDGAGGGGAGGTIFISATSVANLQLAARGGNGGHADNGNTERCNGPGGGGAGGRIIVPAGVMVQAGNLAGGQAGQSIQSTACAAGNNGAQPGSAGTQGQVQLPLVESFTPVAPPMFAQQPLSMSICPGDSVVLTTSISGSISGLQWQLNTGAGWVNLTNNATYSGAQNDTLIIRNITPAMSGYAYSLRASSLCYPDASSQPAVLTVLNAPAAMFTSNVSGSTVSFSNTSQAGSTFSWNFGDGQSSADSSPTHTYALPGTYTVQLIATNACGTDTATAAVLIIALPQAAFTANVTTGCTPLTVSYNSAGSGGVLTYAWSFPGGQPATSNQAAPTVTYQTAGTYDVRLIVGNASGFDTLLLPQYIQVSAAPTALFSAQPTGGLSYNFSNSSLRADSYQWNFGDGATSTLTQPTHTYAMPGFYTVTLTTVNACGSAQYMVNITVGQMPSASFGQSVTEGCAPMAVQYNDQSTGVYTSRQWQFPGGTPATSTQQSQLVIYTLPGTYSATLQLGGPLGMATFTQPNAVTAHPYPEPVFTFSVQALTVTFFNNSSNATSYSWLFGDGNSSQAAAPVHTYAAPGTYTVTLNAQRPFCAASTTMTVMTGVTSSGEAAGAGAWRVFPNPASERLFLQGPAEGRGCRYLFWNAAGQKVLEGTLRESSGELDLQDLPAGLYWLELVDENDLRQRLKVVVM
ncbi:MAG TPA: PKD domain-containing protein [Saprospiraceae bacterium]|nr:PKD domain-containing protein [Saprospiraceae bacterium]